MLPEGGAAPQNHPEHRPTDPALTPPAADLVADFAADFAACGVRQCTPDQIPRRAARVADLIRAGHLHLPPARDPDPEPSSYLSDKGYLAELVLAAARYRARDSAASMALANSSCAAPGASTST